MSAVAVAHRLTLVEARTRHADALAALAAAEIALAEHRRRGHVGGLLAAYRELETAARRYVNADDALVGPLVAARPAVGGIGVERRALVRAGRPTSRPATAPGQATGQKAVRARGHPLRDIAAWDDAPDRETGA
jgi:hypothetical protein